MSEFDEVELSDIGKLQGDNLDGFSDISSINNEKFGLAS